MNSLIRGGETSMNPDEAHQFWINGAFKTNGKFLPECKNLAHFPCQIKQKAVVAYWQTSLRFLKEGYGVGGDAFFSAGEAETLGGGGFDVDLIWFNPQRCRDVVFHFFEVRRDFWFLRDDDGVGIRYFEPAVGAGFAHLLKQ